MIQVSIMDSQILSRVRGLNPSQKNEVLDYLDAIPKQPRHNTRIYRKKAMKQIREALKNL